MDGCGGGTAPPGLAAPRGAAGDAHGPEDGTLDRGLRADRRPATVLGDHPQVPRGHLSPRRGPTVGRRGARGLRPQLVAAGLRARLGFHAGGRGARWWIGHRCRAVRPVPGGRGDGHAGLAGTADSHQRGGCRPVQVGYRRPAWCTGRPGQRRDHGHLVSDRCLLRFGAVGGRAGRRHPGCSAGGRLCALRVVRAGGGSRAGRSVLG